MIKKELRQKSEKKRALALQRYFKTGTGEYGEGDIFIGLTVPQSREIAKKFRELRMEDVKELLHSKVHEERLVALFILVDKYGKNKASRNEIYNFYLANTRGINNWDLVDASASQIAGDFLLDKDRKILYKLATSENLWERRIAIISTYAFIREGQTEDTFRIAEILLQDNHDLIHKAVGWMLREAGKRDNIGLEKFLEKNCKAMPRTMLRYAIERLPEGERKKYLSGSI